MTADLLNISRKTATWFWGKYMTDNKNIILCPACNNSMNKIYVPSEGIDIDICPNCGGIFFDKGEMFKINNNIKNIQDIRNYLEKYYSESDFILVSNDDVRICPVCNIEMDKHFVANNTVLMDSCKSCNGVFLDKGELDKIRNAVID